MKLLRSLRPLHLSHAVPKTAAEGAAAALPRRPGRKLVATLGAGVITVALASVGTTVTLAKPAAADVTVTGPIIGYQGLCLDDRFASTANYNPIQVYTCNGTAAQSWTVDSTTNTLLVLGMCLDVKGGGTANGTTVDLYTCNGTGAQVWVPQPNGELVNPQSGKCLDDTGYGGSGTQAQIWACTGNANQQWTLPSSGGGGSGGSPPASFWGNTSAIPAATHVLEVAVVNQTNGQYPDSQVYWSFNGQEASIAQQRYIDMPANSAGRMYFYLGSPNSPYFDFIEFTVGASSINVDTTRVDRFGLKLALLLHGHDGSNQEVGENYATFQESRAATFQRFQNAMPAQFKELATDQAPYGIPSPGNDPAFQAGGAYANYFTSYAASVGDTTDSTAQVFGCSGTLATNPSLCAGLNRHVAELPAAQQSNPANFYLASPANYYAQFWHQNAINGLQYGFPYDDYAGQSSDISVTNPQYMVVAVGW